MAVPHAMQRLLRNRSGSAAALFAVALPPLLTMAAVAIDVGSLYTAERRLQGIADAAAAAAVSRRDIAVSAPDTIAAVIAQSEEAGIVIDHVTPGVYLRDPSKSLHDRFVKRMDDANAVEVELVQTVDLLLAGPILGAGSSQVTAFARAARTEMVAFELNTRTAAVSNPLVVGLVKGLLGQDIDLSDDAVDALLSETFDLLSVAGELKRITGAGEATFAELFEDYAMIADILEAMAMATDNPALREMLLDMADRSSGETVRIAEIIDLGPYGHLGAAVGDNAVKVDAFALLRAVLEQAGGPGYDVSLDLDLAGLGAVDLRLAGGRGFERSPWLSISDAYDVVLRTGQTRIHARIGANLAGLGKLKLPLFVELAPAEAQISAVVCDPADVDNGVTIDTTPSVGQLALGDVDLDRFDDFGTALVPEPATILRAPLVSVAAFSHVELGGRQSVPVHFSLREIREEVRKEAGTRDLMQTSVATLLGNTEIGVKTLGIGLGTGLLNLDDSIAALLGKLTPGIDTLLNQITSLAGVKLGVAEVAVNRLQCGRPALVA